MKQIVVLGSGFAGTTVVRELERIFRREADVAITLISRQNYMVFSPLLPEIAGNIVEPRHAAPPVRIFLRRARFQQAEVLSVDVAARQVQVLYPDQSTTQIGFDYLVIGLGSVTNYQRAPGADASSFDLKSLEDAIRLRNHVLLMLELADHTEDPAARQALLTFVAAGGGYAGLEGLGQLIDFVSKALRYYPSLKRSDLRFLLASHSPELLKDVDAKLGAYVVHKLQDRGVDVRLGVSVTAVSEDAVVLDPGGSIPTHTVLWAAGIAVSPVVEAIDLPKDRHGALKVQSTLQVESNPHIFALGDCAAVPSATGTYAPTAQNAIREAKTVAQNIAAHMRGGSLRAFHFVSIGSLASIGHYQAVARIFGVSFSGFPAWLAWRAVYLAKLPSLARRVRVLLDWGLEMVLRADIVQLPVMSSDDMRFMAMRDAHTKMIEQGAAHHDGKQASMREAQRASDAAPAATPVTPLEG